MLIGLNRTESFLVLKITQTVIILILFHLDSEREKMLEPEINQLSKWKIDIQKKNFHSKPNLFRKIGTISQCDVLRTAFVKHLCRPTQKIIHSDIGVASIS